MTFRAQEGPLLVSLQKIWDYDAHNALTDLIRYQNKWYCVFRESDAHVNGRNGIIRLIVSHNGIVWQSAAHFQEPGVDLRDPKLSITPLGQLMILMGGSIYDQAGQYITRQPRVVFSKDGFSWSPLEKILSNHDWLWRVTWHKGKAYGFIYRFSNPHNLFQEWAVSLVESVDGLNYIPITNFNIKGYPNETTLRFLPSGEMIALLRRDRKHDNHAWIGASLPPYKKWQWTPTPYYFGGPNFLLLDERKWWAAGRFMYITPYGPMEKTVLARMSIEGIEPALILPSGGDTSYPGLVYYEGYLWISYYSSHEDKTAIYLAKILLP